MIYIPGYDPRGLPEYYRMFRTEFRRFTALYGLQTKIGKMAHTPDRLAGFWLLTAANSEWMVDTRFDFLRWEDIIRKDFARPWWWTLLQAWRVLAVTIVRGTFAAMFRAHWRFALFYAYPFVTCVGVTLVAALGGVAAGYLTALLVAVPLVGTMIGLVIAALIFSWVVRWAEPHTYMLYLLADIVSTFAFAHGRRPDWDRRLDEFARYVVEAAHASDCDELLVVGHSSGSFLAVDVVARAFALDPELGRHVPRLALLTVGSNLPFVGFHKAAQWFRDRIAQLAAEPNLVWVDYQSRKDFMNFYPFDPVSGHGIKLKTRAHNPTVIAISFRDIIAPENYKAFRRRFFRVHFQFIMANEKPAAYDYYMIVCGPLPLRERAASPRAAGVACAVGMLGETRRQAG